MNPTAAQLDAIMDYLSHHGMCEFEKIREQLNLSLAEMATACIILKYDGNIDTIHPEDLENPFTLWLEKKGLAFLTAQGGYTEKKRKDDLNDRQIESMIATNNSVKDTNRIQKIILIITACLAAASLLISVMDYLKKDAPTINVTPAPVRVVLQQQAPTPSIRRRDTTTRQQAAHP